MRHHRPHQSLFALLALTLITPATAAWALEPETLFEKVSPSIVVVVAMDSNGKPVSQGSGVVVASGEVATNCHVLQPGTRYQVKQGGNVKPATLVRGNTDHDLCILSAPALTAPPVSLRGVKGIKVGARVYAVGAPKGLELTLSEGLISSLRPMENSQIIQTNAAISPGSSGGGLFDADGQLIGITTFYLTEGQNLNFALPTDWITTLPRIASAAKKTDERMMDWLTRAVALEKKKNWTGLLAHAQGWVKAEPGNALAHAILGEAYGNLKQYSQAVETFQTALRLNPEDAETWYNLGNIYSSLNQISQAMDAYRTALRLNPELAVAWYSLGLAYQHLKQYPQAVDAYRTALRLNPEDAMAWNNLGFIYGHINQISQAVGAFQTALRINPKNTEAWYNLGLTYLFLGQKDQALEVYKQLRRLDQTKAEELFNLIVPAGQ
jgi:S1-C subfamily serine protease